jgi:hypothetical protein
MPRLFAIERAINSRPATSLLFRPVRDTWFTRIDDHIDYLMIRIDPDKVTPLKDERESRDYLQK